MKISLNWLADYVELPGSADELARILTMVGLEVEGIERLGHDLGGVVVARIVESRPHPDAQRLSVTRVDAGGLGVLQVVCGARNFKVGDKVPLAMVGASLPGGKAIEKATLRGVESFGMLCSEKELKLADDASGLLILDPSLEVGHPIATALGLVDVALEVNVTPNRPDCLSHVGIAREVAAATGRELKLLDVSLKEGAGRSDAHASVRVEQKERCPRYAARVVEGVTIAPSPRWLQNRLCAVGVRSLSNAVDITNFVMLELGQPLHAFDLDLVPFGRIVVRCARPNEKMKTLDGKERALLPEDLCICDEKVPLALAGVMGGATSEVSAKTKRILLESAFFAPAGIRRTSRRHALQSESSFRFERGVDPGGVLFAQDRAARLFADLCGGTVLAGRVDACAAESERRRFVVVPERVGALLGVEVGGDSIGKTLASLGFGVKPTASGLQIEVPTWRGDVEGVADCAEEVARCMGYDRIPSRMPRGAAELMPETATRRIEVRARQALSGAGFDEVVNFSFVAARDLVALERDVRPIALKNPMAQEQAVMRTTMWAGLLNNLSHSLRRQADDVRLYELARTYRPSTGPKADPPAEEKTQLSGVLFGSRQPLQWSQPKASVDFFDLKGAVETVLGAVGIRDGSWRAVEHEALHPRSSCEIASGGRRLGVLGELHPRSAVQFDLPAGVFLFELDFDALVEASRLIPSYSGVPRFPAVLRDMALTLDGGVAAAEVEKEIRAAGEGLVEEVLLFDVYRGSNIPAGKKSLAFSVRYRAADRTLTDDEAGRAHAAIVVRLGERFSAELRA